MSTGKVLRLRHIFREDGKALIVAMDHAAIAGDMEKLKVPSHIIGLMASGGADGVLTTRGMLEKGRDSVVRNMGVILRISGGFTILTDPDKFEDRIISSIETAIRAGADAVAITIKYGHHKEGEFIEHASMIADLCQEWQMPLMIEIMVKGERVHKIGKGKSLAIACRSAFELGADFVKTGYPDTQEEFRQMVEGCPIPLVVLGSEKKESREEVFKMIKDSIDAGGAGIAMGRNVWGNPHPEKMVDALRRLIHEGISVNEAISWLQPPGGKRHIIR